MAVRANTIAPKAALHYVRKNFAPAGPLPLERPIDLSFAARCCRT